MASRKNGRDLCAIKTVNLEEVDECFDEEDLLMLLNELKQLKQLNHQNILSLFESFTNDTEIWCVYPYMHYGTLSDILNHRREEGLSEPAIQIISKSVLLAIQYLHSKYIIHRCVCPENIYVSRTGHVQLGGFKFSVSLISHGSLTRKLYDYPPKIKSYMNYLGPEVLQQVWL